MSTPVYPTEGLLARLNAELNVIGTPADGALAGAKIALFKNDFVPLKSTVFADVDLADFSGYVEKTATWGIVFPNAEGSAELLSQLCTWTPSGTAVPNTIYGVLLYKGTTLLSIERWDEPIAVLGPTTPVNLVYRECLPFGQGSAVIVP